MPRPRSWLHWVAPSGCLRTSTQNASRRGKPAVTDPPLPGGGHRTEVGFDLISRVDPLGERFKFRARGAVQAAVGYPESSDAGQLGPPAAPTCPSAALDTRPPAEG